MANLMQGARAQRYAVAAHALRDKALPYLPTVVNALLVLLLAYTLAHLTWRAIAPAPITLPPAPPPATAAQAAAAPEGSTLRQVASLQLFGRAAPEVAQAPIEAPDTRLRLTLRGVVASGDPQSAMVIIADESGREQHYFVGADLPGGAVLEQVYPDRVILSRENRYETLRLPREETRDDRVQSARTTPPRARPAAARSRVPQLPSAAEAAQAAATGGGGAAADEAVDDDDGATLGQYREQLVNDPQSLWNLVQVHPVLEDGRIKGFTLSPQRDEHLFRAAGWRPGDVITQVNGIALDDTNALQEVFGQLTSADSVALEVERGGRSQQINLQF
ncbi:type II secretion system protein GspC [Ectothiorhodospiraceae bacterium 2226]|nr:type II secretion system protein GspC [Ectothiorhodospiraceae bacterium 2226]